MYLKNLTKKSVKNDAFHFFIIDKKIYKKYNIDEVLYKGIICSDEKRKK